MATLTKDEQIVGWKRTAFALWCMLDDIDTYADMTKGDREAFFKATRKKVGHRFIELQSDGYHLYLPSEAPEAKSGLVEPVPDGNGEPTLKERLEAGG